MQSQGSALPGVVARGICTSPCRCVLAPQFAEATHDFCARGVDWGFTTFMALRDVLDPKRGFLKDDTLEVPLAPGHLPSRQYTCPSSACSLCVCCCMHCQLHSRVTPESHHSQTRGQFH